MDTSSPMYISSIIQQHYAFNTIMKRRTFLKSSALAGAASMIHLPAPGMPRQRTSEPVPDQWLQDAVDEAIRMGAAHASALFISQRHQNVQVRKDQVHAINDSDEAGITLRVRRGMAMGSASVPAVRRGSPKDFARAAVEMADIARPGLPEGAVGIDDELLSDVSILNSGVVEGSTDSGSWTPQGIQDPFLMETDQRVAFLRDLNNRALKIPQIPYAVSNQFLQRRSSLLVDSKGGRIEQTQYASYVNFAVTAFSQQRRLMDTRTSEREAQATDWAGATTNMQSELETAMQEVLRLQQSDPVTADSYDLVMHPTLLWNILLETLLPHFDPRQLAGRDGRSPGDRWLAIANGRQTPLRSSALRLHWDNTLPNGLATAGWDDAGAPALSRPLIAGDGSIANIPVSLDLMLTDPVYHLGFPGMLHSRAAAWNLPAGVAMPNVVLQAGAGRNLDDLISGVDNGLFVKGRGTVVTNPAKTLFRVRPQAAWVIRGGRIAEMVRDVEIETSTEQFWNGLVEVGRAEDTFLGGDLFPRRAFPLWDTPFSVATPPALFRNIPVYRAEARA